MEPPYAVTGEGEVAFFSAKRWDRRNRADLIESAIPYHDAQVVGSYWVSNPFHQTVLAAMSEDYYMAPQHLQTDAFESNFIVCCREVSTVWRFKLLSSCILSQNYFSASGDVHCIHSSVH